MMNRPPMDNPRILNMGNPGTGQMGGNVPRGNAFGYWRNQQGQNPGLSRGMMPMRRPPQNPQAPTGQQWQDTGFSGNPPPITPGMFSRPSPITAGNFDNSPVSDMMYRGPGFSNAPSGNMGTDLGNGVSMYTPGQGNASAPQWQDTGFSGNPSLPTPGAFQQRPDMQALSDYLRQRFSGALSGMSGY